MNEKTEQSHRSVFSKQQHEHLTFLLRLPEQHILKQTPEVPNYK